MKIFNNYFTELIMIRGEKYINSLSKYKSESIDDTFFNNNNESISITSISFKHCYSKKNIKEFDDYDGTIELEYHYYTDDYCGGLDRNESKISLPSWILSDKSIFDKRLNEKIKELDKREFENKQRIKRIDLENLKDLAKKLGYEIKKDIK